MPDLQKKPARRPGLPVNQKRRKKQIDAVLKQEAATFYSGLSNVFSHCVATCGAVGGTYLAYQAVRTAYGIQALARSMKCVSLFNSFILVCCLVSQLPAQFLVTFGQSMAVTPQHYIYSFAYEYFLNALFPLLCIGHTTHVIMQLRLEARVHDLVRQLKLSGALVGVTALMSGTLKFLIPQQTGFTRQYCPAEAGAFLGIMSLIYATPQQAIYASWTATYLLTMLVRSNAFLSWCWGDGPSMPTRAIVFSKGALVKVGKVASVVAVGGYAIYHVTSRHFIAKPRVVDDVLDSTGGSEDYLPGEGKYDADVSDTAAPDPVPVTLSKRAVEILEGVCEQQGRAPCGRRGVITPAAGKAKKSTARKFCVQQDVRADTRARVKRDLKALGIYDGDQIKVYDPTIHDWDEFDSLDDYVDALLDGEVDYFTAIAYGHDDEWFTYDEEYMLRANIYHRDDEGYDSNEDEDVFEDEEVDDETALLRRGFGPLLSTRPADQQAMCGKAKIADQLIVGAFVAADGSWTSALPHGDSLHMPWHFLQDAVGDIELRLTSGEVYPIQREEVVRFNDSPLSEGGGDICKIAKPKGMGKSNKIRYGSEGTARKGLCLLVSAKMSSGSAAPVRCLSVGTYDLDGPDLQGCSGKATYGSVAGDCGGWVISMEGQSPTLLGYHQWFQDGDTVKHESTFFSVIDTEVRAFMDPMRPAG